MIIQGVVNPSLASLLCRVRHTNRLVIADVAFPYWPEIETVDLSLVRGVPTILQVLAAVMPNFKIGECYMAEEFHAHNGPKTRKLFAGAVGEVPISFEPHLEFKKRVPGAIGLIRTGDPTMYGNMILVSA